tara:strand:+ start:257 stop:484 length:228 start_codon:yes stop_codon:yes gene_type:complete
MGRSTFYLGELVYLTNRLARGSPDPAFTEGSGPGMIVDILVEDTYKPRYTVKWLKSDLEMVFHEDVLMRVEESSV